jgi:hypothetical protein
MKSLLLLLLDDFRYNKEDTDHVPCVICRSIYAIALICRGVSSIFHVVSQ